MYAAKNATSFQSKTHAYRGTIAMPNRQYK